MQKILCICTGNICRSPMAEGLLRAELEDAGIAPRVESAGVGAVVGQPATPEAVRTVAARGLDISAHRGRQLDAELALSFELLLVMEEGHLGWLAKRIPQTQGRAFLLGHWRGREIPDPIGEPIEAYERVYSLIEECVRDWKQKLSGR